MDGKMLARLGAIVFVSFAITATAIEMARKDAAPETERVHAVEPKRDALREGQRRCQQLGTTAANDAECLAVWAESRDRFLGRSPAPAAPSSSEGR